MLSAEPHHCLWLDWLFCLHMLGGTVAAMTLQAGWHTPRIKQKHLRGICWPVPARHVTWAQLSPAIGLAQSIGNSHHDGLSSRHALLGTARYFCCYTSFHDCHRPEFYYRSKHNRQKKVKLSNSLWSTQSPTLRARVKIIPQAERL